ncbi:MAG: flagellar biosynthesis anti-sigma factor FlgM [Methylococcales bacterium]|jgi:negative regulator of flagellin synthesis FlgM|nr:flagellar biosynthesis anti-sigma factor FlgM [Methylococcales bacterium]MBT7410097.1 flagellar biosynthesis anti-sigma factor FlgM [Methylococcales bacterium]
MTIDLSSINSGAVQNSLLDRTVPVTAGPTEQTAEQAETGTSTVKDTVSFSNAAERLQSVNQTVAKLPVVDVNRVEQIRNELANGTYKLDAESVADKIIAFEGLF